MSQFTKEYFIEKFSAIPEDKWTTSELTSPDDPECHCALGHCGVIDLKTPTPEAKKLASLLKPVHDEIFKILKGQDTLSPCIVYQINDLADNLGLMPKERILKALSMVTAP